MRDALISLFDKIVSYAGKNVTYQDVIKNLNILDQDYYFKFTEYFLTEDNGANILNAFATILSNGFDAEIFIQGLSENLEIY